MSEVKINTDELRGQLKAAEARQRELATEHATNEADIREASKLAARQRADAARHGESVSAAAVFFEQLVGVPVQTVEEKVGCALDGLFLRGFPDVVAAIYRRVGLPEDRVFDAVMDAADRLDRDEVLVGELVWGIGPDLRVHD